jgi:hypothetical protein
MKQLHIFRAGEHTASDGSVIRFTEADVAAIAAAYDPSLREAPIVVGHPRTDAPAFGWIASLSSNEGHLFGFPRQVDPQFADAVRDGRFKKISVSLYGPTAPGNPRPGGYYLRHVGFLGAAQPAVAGLRPVQFADGEDGVVEFADAYALSALGRVLRGLREWIIEKFTLDEADRVVPSYVAEDLQRIADAEAVAQPQPAAFGEAAGAEAPAGGVDLAEREAALADLARSISEREAALAQERAEIELLKSTAKQEAQQEAHRREAVAFLESLGGRLLPRQVTALLPVLMSLETLPPLAFSEEGRRAGEVLRRFLAELPVQVDFTEHSSALDAPDPNDAAGLANAARKFMETERRQGRVVSAARAVEHVRRAS